MKRKKLWDEFDERVYQTFIERYEEKQREEKKSASYLNGQEEESRQGERLRASCLGEIIMRE